MFLIDPVIAFALEPHGNKLAIIHGEPPTRIAVTFYLINDKGNPPTIISELLYNTCIMYMYKDTNM